ncbi:hypothetical protein AAZX31_20G081400 [Glycine max]
MLVYSLLVITSLVFVTKLFSFLFNTKRSFSMENGHDPSECQLSFCEVPDNGGA